MMVAVRRLNIFRGKILLKSVLRAVKPFAVRNDLSNIIHKLTIFPSFWRQFQSIRSVPNNSPRVLHNTSISAPQGCPDNAFIKAWVFTEVKCQQVSCKYGTRTQQIGLD